jgi:hypothetical protein
MTAQEEQLDQLASGAYYALFKVVSVADLAGATRAADWARAALEDEQLMRGFVQGIAEHTPVGGFNP